MPSYRYRAAAAAGGTRTGEVEAADLDQAIGRVRELGLVPIRLDPAVQAASSRSSWELPRRRVRTSELILFTRQLETMLDAGLPLLATLETLEPQAGDPALRDAVRGVRGAVEQGSTLTEAMRAYPHCFPTLYVNLVHAGEEGGLLPAMLDRLGGVLEHQEETRQRIQSAVFYPVIVMSELLIAFIVLVKLVLPRFASLFRNLNAELPFPTRVLIGASDFFDAYGLQVLIAAIAAGAGFALWVRTDDGRRRFDSWILSIPLFGPIAQKVAMARFARVLAALVESGVPIVRAVAIARGVLGNRSLEIEIDRMRDGLMAGEGLAAPLKGSRAVPPLMVRMIAAGEETGSLGKMLVRAARFYDRDVDYTVRNLATALEPALLLVLGISVLFTALAVFLPLWNLMNAYRH
jgi:type II secretory pathway component PulF